MLKQLKFLLNSYDDEKLREMTLWIDCEKAVNMAVAEEDGIILITEDGKDNLKINDKYW